MGSEIIAFPLHRRRKLIADLARILQSKQGHEATLFWRETAKTLLQQLVSSGVTSDRAEDQVRSLLYAIVSAMEADAMEVRG